MTTIKHKTIKEKAADSFKTMKDAFGYKNLLQAPRITKVVISSATGSIKDNKKKELIGDRLTKITGQKATVKSAKKSVASFKVRQGDAVGWQVTLRGERMWSFLEKLVNIALPRTRDFRGVSTKSIDVLGNYTLGIKEHTVFPETADEELKDVFGFAVTIVTTSDKTADVHAYLNNLGFLFKKDEVIGKVAKQAKTAKKQK